MNHTDRVPFLCYLVVCILVVSVISPPVGGAVVDGPSPTDISNEEDIFATDSKQSSDNRTVIVRFKEPTQTETDQNIASQKVQTSSMQAQFVSFADSSDHIRIEESFWLINAALVTIDTTHHSLDSIRDLENVTGIHRNVNIENNVTTIRTQPNLDASSNSGGIQNESQYANGVERIGSEQVWNQNNNRGGGVRVAVLDSGVDAEHPDINITQDNWAEFNDSGSFVESEPYDPSGHGTHVSGRITGGNNSGTAIGVAPNATLLHAKVLDENGAGTFAGVVAGLQWAIEMDADVVSLSFGTSQKSQFFIDPIQNAEENGVVTVAAVGNSGATTSSSPANVYESVAVGGINKNDTVPPFSGGEQIDTNLEWSDPPSHWPSNYFVPAVVAPSTEIISAGPDREYTRRTGTSMAVPHVSGVAALLLADSNGTLRPIHIRERFATTAQTPNDSVSERRYGHGIINATLAVDSPNLPVGESELPPRDHDHDGLYTDVSGDGNLTVTDVELLFYERESEVVKQNSEHFDLDGDSNVSVGDAQELYNQNISSDTNQDI